jgi:hypothetical protein
LNTTLSLGDVSQPNHDGITSDRRNVQHKGTFKEQLTFKNIPDYYLGFRLHTNGRYEAIFNGPGRIIYDHYSHRKGIGGVLLSFPVSELRGLSKPVE